jgi:hypothetical protein
MTLPAAFPWLAAAGCLMVALVFAMVRPPRPPAGMARPRAVMLRWGHPCVWLLLAGAALSAGPGLSGPAARLALAAGGLYLSYLATLIGRG